tara:strand:- start:3204 stop:4457 length:1254 start_codon:yes stop_codon:yes gene_type:complete
MHSKKMLSIKSAASFISSLIFALILSACGNSEDADKVKAALEINQLDISSIEITSVKSIMEVLEILQITAKAVIGDDISGSTDISNKVKWSSSNNEIASINSSGLLTGKSVGLVTITARLADLVATKDIQLSDALLETIDIMNSPSPVSVCQSGYTLKANGNYDDATNRDITSSVTWSSDDATRLSIDNSGVFSTYKDGTSVVTATKNSIAGNTTITIDDDITSVQITSTANSVYIGKTLAFTATGTYDDTSTTDITNTVTWSSDNTDYLTISNDTTTKGIATGVAEGTANISANCLTTVATPSNSVAISVTEEPTVNDISIEEDESIIEFKIVDSPEQLTANLKRSDNTYSTDVSDNDYTDWSVTDTISGTALTISNTGEITFSAVGITEIKVRYYDDDNNIGPFTDTIEVKIVAN